MRPVSDLVLWLWRLERRIEFLYRPYFDRWLRPPLFDLAQRAQNKRRTDEHLSLAEEKLLDDEEELTQQVIDEISAFTRENWLPGGAQRFGNTKTFGVLRAEFTVPGDLPAHLRHGLFAQPGTYPAYVRFSGPGPLAPPDLEDLGQCSVAIKVMGVPGDKLMEDEKATQDLIMVSPASFVTPNIRENAKLQRWVRAKAPLGYAVKPGDSHLLHLFMQLLYSPMHSNPLEVQYYSNVPFLLGEGQAVQYSLKPRKHGRTRIPMHPAENYLRDAMVRTLRQSDWSMDFMVQVQTDAHLMPIEDATVKWPEDLSPYIPVAHLRLLRQRFTSDAQLRFADVLRYNPWHSLPEHRPLGNSNRARRRMYLELAKLRQSMNDVQHVEPTGQETFDDPAAALHRRTASRDAGVVLGRGDLAGRGTERPLAPGTCGRVIGHADAVPAGVLGVVQRGVGVRVQVSHALGVRAGVRHAHAHRELQQPAAGQRHRVLPDHADELLGPLARDVLRTGRHQEGDLVAADPADHGVRPGVRFEDGGDVDERGIADGVAEAVVHGLEPVDVEHDERRPVGADGTGEGALHGVVEDPAGDEPGQRVDGGLLAELGHQRVLLLP